ncbi:hypothetical protein MKX01_010417 [Papaver californicum]|nr:hypothetical protein MKX01_010417 [Papaver californicum]
MDLPFGVTTWWFNQDDTELVILFMGNTSTSHKVGEFTEFALTGANGLFTGFTTEFVARAWDLEEDKVKELVGSQKGTGIIKVKDGSKCPNVDIKNGGRVVLLNTKSFPLVKDVGLGADLVRLDFLFNIRFIEFIHHQYQLCFYFILIFVLIFLEILNRINVGSMCSPGFSCDLAYQVTYIVRGSGRAQIVGIDGKRKMEIRVKAGNLFIVPRFFVVSKIADGEGMEWFSIITTPNPIFCHLAGWTSVWKALSPEVLQGSFNVSPEAEQHFRSKRLNAEIFFPTP